MSDESPPETYRFRSSVNAGRVTTDHGTVQITGSLCETDDVEVARALAAQPHLYPLDEVPPADAAEPEAASQRGSITSKDVSYTADASDDASDDEADADADAEADADADGDGDGDEAEADADDADEASDADAPDDEAETDSDDKDEADADGFDPAAVDADDLDDLSYTNLQAVAKAHDLPATGKQDELRDAIADEL